MIFNWTDYKPVTYGEYEFPGWAEGLGWGIASLSLVCIPIGMIKAVYEAKGPTLLKVRHNSKAPANGGFAFRKPLPPPQQKQFCL